MTPMLVFGSINLDVSLRMPHLPRPGETVIASRSCLTPGGKGANQAHAASLYGASVRLVGAVGEDELAEPALALLTGDQVDLGGVRRLAAHSTGLATVHVDAGGANAIVVSPGANAAVCASWVDDELIDRCGSLLLQWEAPPAQSMELARRMRAKGKTVLLNLAPARDLHAVRPGCIDWLIVNETELQMVCDHLQLPGMSTAVATRVIADAWSCSVVATLGADGAMASLADGRQWRIYAQPVQAVDTTGAGDTFCGVFAAAIALGERPDDALRSACTAASLSCMREGAQAAQPTRQEVLAARGVQQTSEDGSNP